MFATIVYSQTWNVWHAAPGQNGVLTLVTRFYPEEQRLDICY